MKRTFQLSAIFAVVASLAACGGNDDAPNNGTAAPTGTWLAGDLHSHTVQSADAGATQTLSLLLDKAIGVYGLDYLALTNHLRLSNRDDKGTSVSPTIPFALGMARYEVPAVQSAQSAGSYAKATIVSGFEWDMPTHDHLGIAIFDNGSTLTASTKMAKEFEYVFTTESAASFDSQDVAAWNTKYAGKRYNATADDALQAIAWLKTNFPETSWMVVNHPSRNKRYTIADFRSFHDIAPGIFVAIEGMVGNQMEPDRGGYTSAYTADFAVNRVYGGVDAVVAKLGGAWDALLGEGRRIWNVADSDSHFKVIGTNSSGYYPGEYAKTYLFAKSNDPAAILAALKSGKSFGVFGDLINALEFSVAGAAGAKGMGEELSAAAGETVTITIAFKSPATNHYKVPYDNDAYVAPAPVVDHVDLIVGEVTAKAAAGTAAYDAATNPSTRVLKRFTKADWKVDANGYARMSFVTTATKGQYFRLRGTNLDVEASGLMSGGEPLADQKVTTADATQRFNDINDRNYKSLWFYSNPVFVSVK